MDPNATFQDLALANLNGEREEAREHAVNLRDWLNRGGFLPSAMTREDCDKQITIALSHPAGWDVAETSI